MNAVQPILVVEDEGLIRLDLVDTLETGGFTVVECSDAASALAIIDADTAICGLVTDIRLGAGPSGWDLARHGRQKYPELAVLYITGDSAAEWSVQGVPNSLLMQKPFAGAQLVTAIANLLIQARPQTAPESAPGE